MKGANNYPLSICCFVFSFLFLSKSGFSQTSILERRITVNIQDATIEESLKTIEKEGKFSFSYNPAQIPLDSTVSFSVNNIPVGSLLDELFNQRYQYKTSGAHLILLPEQLSQKQEKNKYIISGYVVNKRTGEFIPNATVYDVDRRGSAITNASGYYELTVSSDKEMIGVGVSKFNYFDTVIVMVPQKAKKLDVHLAPQSPLKKAPVPSPVSDAPKRDVDEIGIVKIIVPQRQRTHSENLRTMLERIPIQISLVPGFGTNNLISGSLENNFSLNILAGYSYGVKGAELGGLLNIIRQDVTGVQLSGFANIVGGEVMGFQGAGFSNNLRGSLKGVQAAGFSNIVLDTIHGVQLSGFSNIVRGKITGAQVSGFSNVSTKDVDGMQISGFSNVAALDVNTGQISGFDNYGRNIIGVQIAGFSNIASKEVKGVQIAGFSNVAAGNVSGVQIAGFSNYSHKDIEGTQISGFLNYGRKIKGSQIGFLNINDSVTGFALGFMTLSMKGYHELELASNDVMNTNLTFKTGLRGLYNIFTAGIMTEFDKPVDFSGWGFGYGLGSEIKINRFTTNFDLVTYQINEGKDWINKVNLLNRLSMNVGFYITKDLVVSAGPSVNLQITELTDSEGNYITRLPENPFWEKENDTYKMFSWIGWQAGVRW